MGGMFHLKFNTCLGLIVNNYHEGKLKRTLERELNVFEFAGMDVIVTNISR